MIAGLLVLCGSAVAFGVRDYIVPATWRYKITVEVETPEGIKTGSSVREVRAWKNGAIFLNPDISPIMYEVIGEAVVIDLGDNDFLFGLLDDTSFLETERAFETICSSADNKIKCIANIKIGTKSTLKDCHPKIVKFQNINNPKSISLVYEYKKLDASTNYKNHFHDLYGDGYDLKIVTVEITDEKITNEINNIIPWLRLYARHKGYIGGAQSPPFADPSHTFVRLSNFERGE